MRPVHITALALAAGMFGVTARDVAMRLEFGEPAFTGLHLAVLAIAALLAYLGGKGAFE
ncbi:MAG TPA: hypothetical protein VJN32_04490 [Dehalococcoidia bacterium]|nr:hypothetical protein [Dehalococcoidia bacterium]